MRGRPALALVLLVGTAAPVAAQRGTEWQFGGVGTVADAWYAGGGVAWAHRASRLRLTVGATGGALEERAAGRGELLVGYLLTPQRRRGVGVYAAGGLAAVATRDRVVGRLVALVGVEGTPGGRSGWYVELGVGGGVRIAAGGRIRSLRR